MTETRKLAAILVSDVVGYSRLAGADEEGVLARLRALRRELIDPKIALHKGRIVKSTGDGVIVEFRSAVDAVRAAIEVQMAMFDRNAGIPEDRQIAFRIGVHVGDVIEESDGDLMGDGVNIAARLEGVAKPGGVCLSEAAYWQVKSRLDLAITDLGDTKLKNIAEPIRAYALQVGVAATPRPTSPPEPARLALPEKPSIAVLPFTNMSGDAEQDYFCDGMVEDIITGLSRIKGLFVIARNSSFTYKGRAVDIRQVGRELGVRYVLEGSVRKAGARLRITAQLIEAETGAHLWADKFDGALEDVFDLQDKITEAIVGTIEPNLRRAEIERAKRKRPENLDAYDLFLRAMPHLMSVMPEDAEIGIGHLEAALKLDPNYAAAHAYLAWALEMRFFRGGFNAADAAEGLRHARAAVAHGGDDAAALAMAAVGLLHLGRDFEAASDAIRRALALNSSSATALYLAAHVNAYHGDASLVEDYSARALRLSPFDPLAFEGHYPVGLVHLRNRRFDEAAASMAKAVQLNPRFSWLYFVHAAALALAGRIEEAGSVAKQGLELEPGFRFGGLGHFNGVFLPELFGLLEAGFRAAGLPD